MIPHIIEIVKHRSTKDISHIFLFLNVIGLSLMCTYGVHIKDRPLSITTEISLFNTLIVITLKAYYASDKNYFPIK